MTDGWIVGYAIGGIVVVVVAVVVLVIIALARRIANNAERITRTIEEARDATEALWQLEETQRIRSDILGVLRGTAPEERADEDKAAAAPGRAPWRSE